MEFGPLVAALSPDRVARSRGRVPTGTPKPALRRQHSEAGTPLAVVRATSTVGVQAAVRFAAAHNLPVVARRRESLRTWAASTGLSGPKVLVGPGCVQTPHQQWAYDLKAFFYGDWCLGAGS